MSKVLVICGPTASGKSSLAIECAKLLNTQIISADSMSVYKQLDIGTAKPSKQEQDVVKHHLIDVVSPESTFSVGDYREMAMPILTRLLEENKTPIICGGTGFYINSLLYNLSYGNTTANEEVREQMKLLAVQKGNRVVYDILVEKDYESAKKLHPNDLKRVIRALEIYYSGTKKSEINDDKKPLFDFKAYSIDHQTSVLYDRINQRVDFMFENGLVKEVNNLLDNGITSKHQCMQGIGYKEIIPYLQGDYTLDECVNLVKLNTRHYAKRQKTFFKRLENIEYLTPCDVKELAEKVVDKL